MLKRFAKTIGPAALALAAPAHAQQAAQSAEPGQAPADLPDDRSAAPASGLTLGFAGGVATDYRFRSISQTDRNPFAYGLVSAQYKNFYVRVGGENVDFNDGTKGEYDLYAGWAPTFGNTALDIGWVRYGYVDGAKGRDTPEWKAAITQTIGKGTIGAKIFYAPDFLTLNTRALYTEINGSYAVRPKLTLSGLFGIEQIHRFDDFKAWNFGAAYAITKQIALDLRYFDTDSHSAGTNYHSAVVAALKFSL